MNKKILIGSIIGVTILIGVSFTSVVSYGSIKSASVLNSPLFDVRTNRAIGQGQQEITTDYLGHGEDTNIHLTGRIHRAEQVQKGIDIIRTMDDKSFSNLFDRIILHIKSQRQTNSKDTSDILQVLHYIRENPNVMVYYDGENSSVPETSEYYSCRWKAVCYVLNILNLALVVTLVIIMIVLRPLTIDLFTCSPYHPVCQTADCAI
ncbi:MAG: hypothetical protein JSW06_03990 [Thermoplasmatales archaeon]|nr:MAG: hypothetical protein JSW06_03990 [Thermoplasmatales archaeon]